MKKVTGKPIKLGIAKELRLRATEFAKDPAIVNAIGGIIPPAEEDTRTFYNNLDCGFVFDKDSLLSLIAKIIAVPDSGLIMMMGASNDSTDLERFNKPTLSIFACTIAKNANSDEKDTYSIIHSNADNENDTDGVEHPGIVNLGESMNDDISRGTIKFLNPLAS